MQRAIGLLVKLLSPVAYVAIGFVVQDVLRLPASVHLSLKQVGDSPAELEAVLREGTVLLFVVALVVFAATTLLLLKLEGTRHPSIWTHLRHSVLWYVFGLSLWSSILSSESPSILDRMVAVLPLAAVLANGLVVGVLRVQRRAA